MDILSKIWKYKFHYLIVIPAVLLLMIFKGIPFITAFLLSFQDFQFARGLMDSPWIGWDNYRQLWEGGHFINALGNTLSLKLIYILLSGVLAFILSLALSSIRSVKLRNTFQSLILLPYFIPTAVFAYIAMLILSIEQSPFFKFETLVLADPSLWRLTVILIEIVSTVGIPVIIATAAIIASSTQTFSIRVYAALRAIIAFMLLQLSTILSFNMELTFSLGHALVHNVAETIDSYGFRQGLFMNEIGQASALWIIQFTVQLVLTIVVYLLIRRWFLHDLFHPMLEQTNHHAAANRQPQRSYTSIVITLLYSFIAITPLLLLIIYPFFGDAGQAAETGTSVFPLQYVFFMVLTLSVVMIYMLMTVTLAYPLTVKDLPGRNVYKLFLLILLTASPIGIHELLLFRNLGIMNTLLAPALSGLVSVIGIFVLKSIFNRKYAHLKEQASREGRGETYSFFMLFLPKVWKPLIALGVLQFVTIWNAYLPSYTLNASPHMQAPLGAFFRMMSSIEVSEVNPAMILKVGLIVSLPAFILFVIFRRWLTSEVFVGEVRK